MTFINVVYVQTIPQNPSIKNVTFARSMFVGRASSGVVIVYAIFVQTPAIQAANLIPTIEVSRTLNVVTFVT